MLSKLKLHLQQRTQRDLVVVVVTCLFGYGLSSYFDLFEQLYQFSREYEHLEIDEFLPAFLFTLLGLCYFSYRRWKDVSVLSNYLEVLSLTCSNFNVANRRALKQVLSNVAKDTGQPHTFVLISIDGLEHIRMNQGFVVVELVLNELLDVLCKQLNDEQLLITWQTGQFIIHAPKVDKTHANQLTRHLIECCELTQPTLQQQLSITGASVTITGMVSEAELIESLEDNLLDMPQKAA